MALGFATDDPAGTAASAGAIAAAARACPRGCATTHRMVHEAAFAHPAWMIDAGGLLSHGPDRHRRPAPRDQQLRAAAGDLRALRRGRRLAAAAARRRRCCPAPPASTSRSPASSTPPRPPGTSSCRWSGPTRARPGRSREDAFERLAAMLLEDLAAAGPIDAPVSRPARRHGHRAPATTARASCSDGCAAQLRDLPIVAALDLHANVSEAMVTHSDALVAYRTYPHIDLAVTGARCLPLLERLHGRRAARQGMAADRLPGAAALAVHHDRARPGALRPARRSRGGRRALGLDLHGLSAGRHPGLRPDGARLCRRCPRPPSARSTGWRQAFAAAEPRFAGRLWAADEAVAHAVRGDRRPPDDPRRHAGQSRRWRQRRHHRPAGGADRGPGRGCAAGAAVRSRGAPRRRTRPARGRSCAVCALGGRHGPAGVRPVRGDFEVRPARATAGSPPPGRCMAATGWISGRWRCCARAPRRASRSRCRRAGMQAADRAILHHLGVDPARRRILALKSSVHFRADFESLAERGADRGGAGCEHRRSRRCCRSGTCRPTMRRRPAVS